MPNPKPKSAVLSLNDLANQVQLRARRTVERDLSSVFKGEEGSVIFSWREPDTATAYQLYEDAAELKRRNPLWPETLALHVAEIAVCHVSPRAPGDAPGVFYSAIANKDSEAFAAILSAFREAFPAIDPDAEIENAKND